MSTTPTVSPIISMPPLKLTSTPRSNNRRLKVLPLNCRPKQLYLSKKRPQSLVSSSATTKIITPNHPGALHENRSIDCYKCGDGNDEYKHHQQHQLKRTRMNEVKQLPSWSVGDSVDCLLDIPLFHMPSPVTSLVLKCSGSSDGKSISPNQITSKIVQFVASTSGTGEYNSQTVSYLPFGVNCLIKDSSYFKIKILYSFYLMTQFVFLCPYHMSLSSSLFNLGMRNYSHNG